MWLILERLMMIYIIGMVDIKRRYFVIFLMRNKKYYRNWIVDGVQMIIRCVKE